MLIRLTWDMSVRMERPLADIKADIDSGKIKGKKHSDLIYMIDEDYVKQKLNPQSESDPEDDAELSEAEKEQLKQLAEVTLAKSEDLTDTEDEIEDELEEDEEEEVEQEEPKPESPHPSMDTSPPKVVKSVEFPKPYRRKATVSPTNDPEFQEVERLIAFAEKQKLLCDKYVELQEARRNRDKPEILAAKEQRLTDLDKSLTARQQSIQQAQDKLKQYEDQLREQGIKVARDCASQLTVVGEKHKKIKEETDALIAEQQKILDDLKTQVAAKQAEIDQQNETISQFADKVAPLKKQLNQLIGYANDYAVREYHQADKTGGKVSNQHANNATQAWGIADQFKQVLKWLTK